MAINTSKNIENGKKRKFRKFRNSQFFQKLKVLRCIKNPAKYLK